MSVSTSRPLRILVAGHDQKFWNPIQTRLIACGQYEFREDFWPGHDMHDPGRSEHLLEWADVIVAEWALGNAVYYSKRKRSHQRMFIRLHLQERETEFPAKINYQNVDKIVFVSDHLLCECVARFPIPKNKAVVIGNGVDLARFYHQKLPGSEFNLGMVGVVPMRKRLDRAVDTLRVLLQFDNRYTLHIKGPNPDSYNWLWARNAERDYYTELYRRINSSSLRNRVIFDPPGNDVADWLTGIGYLLSPSDFESFHVAVVEGISSGATPIVWNWDGANAIYPGLPLVETPQKAAEMIEWLRRSRTGPRLRSQMSNLVHTRYNVEVVCSRWDALLKGSSDVSDILSDENCSIENVHQSRAKRGVLVVWAIDSWRTFHRREMLQALAAHLLNDCDILLIEPGSHYQTLLNEGQCEAVELLQFLKQQPIQETPNLYRIRAITSGISVKTSNHIEIPPQPSYASTVRKIIQRVFGNNRPVLHWIYKPNQTVWLDDSASFVYEVYDDYTRDFATGKLLPLIEQAESLTLARAKHVFFTSALLAKKKAALAFEWTLAGNGVAYDSFAQYQVDMEPASLQSLRPTVGYLGNLSDFFDWENMLAVASKLAHVDFLFMGPVETNRLGSRTEFFHLLHSLPNTRFTGHVNRDEGAAAVNRCDVLIIPFVQNEAMDAVDPLKLWEYFATGRPILCSGLRTVKDMSLPVRIVESLDDWLRMLPEAIAEVAPVLRAQRIQRAAQANWANITVAHATTVRQLFAAGI